MIRATRAVTIGMFGIFLVAPFLQEHLHLFRYQPLTENRLKIPRPLDWQTLFETGSPFAKQYDEYFNDNYGMRDLLIRTKNSLDYRLFRKSEKVVIGADDWLFLRSVIETIGILLEKKCVTQCDGMCERFLRLHRALAARGITLVILPCPMKYTIYPEMLPATAPRRPNPHGFDRFRKFLKDHPEIVSIDPVPILEDLKGSFRVYHKTDFHWTDPAGAYVAKELINTLGKLNGKGDLWDFPIGMITEALVTGGENASLGLLRPIVEDALFLKEDRRNIGRGEYYLIKAAHEWSYRTKLPGTGKLLPATVMFGDSYGDALLRAGFTAYFEQFQMFSNFDFRTRYAQIPPDTRFVIFEHIEPFLYDLMDPAMWPEEFAGR